VRKRGGITLEGVRERCSIYKVNSKYIQKKVFTEKKFYLLEIERDKRYFNPERYNLKNTFLFLHSACFDQ
jgi:hypothetical protein